MSEPQLAMVHTAHCADDCTLAHEGYAAWDGERCLGEVHKHIQRSGWFAVQWLGTMDAPDREAAVRPLRMLAAVAQSGGDIDRALAAVE